MVRRTLGTGLLVIALAGCGSTVQVRSSSTVNQDGLSGSGSTDGGFVTTAPSSTTGGTTGGSTGTSFGTTGGTSGGSSTGGTSSTGGSQHTPSGVSTTGAVTGPSRKAPIPVGVIYTPGADAAASAIGLSSLSTGDTKAEATAIVSWINAHGGLGGHPLKLYSYAINSSASSQAAAQEEACSQMTQDYKVRYVVTILSSLQTLAACLAKAGVGLLDDETGLGDKAMATYAPYLGNPGELAPGRLMSVMVDDLWNRGWLTATSKIGVLAVDNLDGHDVVNRFLTSALQRHGLTAKATVYVNPNGGDGGSAASGNAALRFRSANVDRVLPVLYSPLYFMVTANSQGYHPAYALYSSLGPGALLESSVPAQQLANAAGIGWQPYLDIGKGTKPGPVSARETLCFSIMKNAGLSSTSATVKGFQVQVCNVLFYLQDLAAKEPAVPKDLLTSARALLGQGFISSDTFRTDVTHRTDGVAGYRSLAYQSACGCFNYVSPVRSTP